MSSSRSLKNPPTTTRCSSARFDLQLHVECLLLAQGGHRCWADELLSGVKRTCVSFHKPQWCNEQQKSRSAGIRRFAAIRRTSSFVSNFIPTGSVIDGVGVV